MSEPGGYSDVQLLPAAANGDHDEQDAAAVLFEKDTCNGIALAVVGLSEY